MPQRHATELARGIEAALRGAGDPERAEGGRRYLKSDLVFFGADAAAIRRAAKVAVRELGASDRQALAALARTLWRRPVFELRAAAVEVLRAGTASLEPEDLALVERFLRESRTWALVDTLAVHVAGPLLVRAPGLGRVLDRWARDGDFWVRRAALLALLLPLRRGGGDFARFSRYADAMLEEKEFFIRKAIGWVLRERAKKEPAEVAAWLAPRMGRASGVTVREAVRYLPERRRLELLAAYRSRRAAEPARARRGG